MKRGVGFLSTVGLGHTLDLVLLLDGVAVGRSLGSINELISEALGDGLDVPERALPGARREEVDCLVDPPQRGDIDGLAPHHTGRADPGGIFPRPTGK